MYGAALTPAKDLPGLVDAVRVLLQDSKAPFGFNLFCPPKSILAHSKQQQQALEAVHRVYAELAVQHSLKCDVQLMPAPDVAQLQADFEAQVEVGLALNPQDNNHHTPSDTQVKHVLMQYAQGGCLMQYAQGGALMAQT